MMSLTKVFSYTFIVFFALANIAYSANSLKIENAWSPEAPPVAKVMAGYMQIHNVSNKDVKISSAESNLFKRVEIHLTETQNGMMRMVKQNNLTIKTKKQVELKPGGLHMMLIGPKTPLRSGSIIPVILTLDNGEKINLDLKVKDEPQQDHHHHHH